MTSIAKIHARQILDSRGNPTLEAEVTLADGAAVHLQPRDDGRLVGLRMGAKLHVRPRQEAGHGGHHPFRW